MNIVVVGAGYVGLVTSACLAEIGHCITCVDQDAARIASLKEGQVPIFEPGLDQLVEAGRSAHRLTFSTDLSVAIKDADAVFMAVGTPARKTDGRADVSNVVEAARQIAKACRSRLVVIVKSTVPVGTCDRIERTIREINPALDFSVVSNPEFLREGMAISDFQQPDRVIIGLEHSRDKSILRQIYSTYEFRGIPIIYTSRRTAELTKYAANAFLAMKVAFTNEMADLCDLSGADVSDLTLGIGLDHRVGPHFFAPGPGFGGSCFPKDTVALIRTAQDLAGEARIVEAVIAANDRRKRTMALKVVTACGGSVVGKTIALLGLTFKKNTDDVRDSPSLAIAEALVDLGAIVRGYDPQGMRKARAQIHSIDFAEDLWAACSEADAVVIATDWDAFRDLDLARLRATLKRPVICDLRNVINPIAALDHGFSYVGVGRGSVRPNHDRPFRRAVSVRAGG
ncbi:UDP-glucose/GDP-mannose dehydrogenase family protein [Mesorhizobium sp. WSM2239]|uniref:UDP-glucose 6-dehydrogenase n=2 Tax=unclassified Mesorhizobium TaxID=325217 RepID=A0AAU8DIZ1_9HYPH